MRNVRRGLELGLLLAASVGAGWAQTPGQGPQPVPGMGPNGHQQADPVGDHMREQQARSRNEERQKRLEDDTAKLYALAGELKQEVAKSNKDTLSLDVVRKAEEIEKLAKSVKEKMKG